MADQFNRYCKYVRVFETCKKTIAVLITSDKAYKNLEIKRGYKENDILKGGSLWCIKIFCGHCYKFLL